MQIEGWRYYNHAMIPSCAPHEEVNMIPLSDKTIWKAYGKKTLLVRWTTNFDCGYETEWWYCIKDTPFNLDDLKAKQRYEINKGIKNFDVKKIKLYEYRDQIFEVYLSALMTYPPEQRVRVERESFFESIEDWKEQIIYGAFDRESDELCGFCVVIDCNSYASLSVQKSRPESEKKAVNAALVYQVVTDFESQLKKDGFYILDGARNILHETRFQDYLEKYFKFKKAYCILHVEYRYFVAAFVKLLYPFRKIIKKCKKGKLLHRISGILLMEEIKRKTIQKPDI